jgi:hypothetical protein
MDAVRPAGTACDLDGNACSDDRCDGAGTCAPGGSLDCGACRLCDTTAGCVVAPIASCLPGGVGSLLDVRTGAPPKKQKVSWRWRGSGIGADAFGDPLAETPNPADYEVCVFLMTHSAVDPTLLAAIPAGGSCGTKPCWKRPHGGFVYQRTDGAPDGVTRLALSSKSPNTSSIALKAAGPAVSLPQALLSGSDVTALVQLRRTGLDPRCWQTQLPPSTSTAERFKGKLR